MSSHSICRLLFHRARRGRRAGRRGFTLLERMAVMAIITVLIAMLLPAIQQAREAARRFQCKNNLMQMGLALCNYESAHGCLPSGSIDVNRPIQNTLQGYHFGWIVQILPQLEQGNLFASADFSAGVHDKKNVGIVGARLKVFICPSYWAMGACYAACHHDVEAPIDIDNHGVMFLNSSIRHDDLIDGASNTIYVGEISETGMFWASGTRDTLRNTGTPINSAVIQPGSQAAFVMNLKLLEVGGFGSIHVGGANFVFGDGSVRFLSENLSMRVFRQLGSRADGDLVGSF